MGKQAIALGHIGLLLGMLGLIVLILEIYQAVAPSPNATFAIFVPLIAWALGVLFVAGEWYELKREA